MNRILTVSLLLALGAPAFAADTGPLFECVDGKPNFDAHPFSFVSSGSMCCRGKDVAAIPKGKHCYWRVESTYLQWGANDEMPRHVRDCRIELTTRLSWQDLVRAICKPKYLGEKI